MKKNGFRQLLSASVHSVRTRSSVAIALFMLIALAVFYVGGRIVLVHLVRDAEMQVRDAGVDIARLARRNALDRRAVNLRCLDAAAAALSGGSSPAEILGRAGMEGLSLLLQCAGDGTFIAGAQRRDGIVEALDEKACRVYADKFGEWIATSGGANALSDAVGIVRFGKVAHYAMMAAAPWGGLVLGSPFDQYDFSAEAARNGAAYSVRIGSPVSDEGPRAVTFGVEPMLSEALEFYSGGFWRISSRPFEAVYAVRDIAGATVAALTVSTPGSFAAIARSAVGRLTFFIAVAGIGLILPLFWIQSRMLLNPLTRMTSEIEALSLRHQDADCPRFEWRGRDEFAYLAASVNRMLETISARTVRLAHLRMRQRALISAVPDALAIFDRRGKVVALTKQPENTAPLPGIAVNCGVGAETFGAAGAEDFATELARVFSTGAIGRVRLDDSTVAAPDAVRRFEMRLSKMEEGFALAIIRDITREHAEHVLRIAAEKRENEALKQASLSSLAAGIAHDVNNVLAVVLNAAESHARRSGEAGRGAPELDAIREAVRRGSSMMRELMTFAGETKMHFVRTPADSIVNDFKAIAGSVAGGNIALEFAVDPDAGEVDVDADQFWKVLFNLVKNATEAIGSRPGRIVVSARPYELAAGEISGFAVCGTLRPGRGTLFSVRDDGPGIPPRLLSRIFDPYISSKVTGHGLGLANVRSVVEAHGGGVRVTTALESGTLFEIFLPAAASDAGENPPHPDSATSAAGTPMGMVLVVDDEAAVRESVATLLKASHIKTMTAAGFDEALEQVRKTPEIGTVLLDANLGEVDAVPLAKRLRVLLPGVRIVVSSGASAQTIRQRFGNEICDGFLAKPYTLSELLQALRPQ